MPTWTILRTSDNRPCVTTTYPECLPDRDTLARMYAAGYVLLEDGRKTTAARRRELTKGD